ncbi:hypothetical protein [Streptomyces ardesiacus]|uniref:hypothetical protein n=1 Tax=Streptomyces ardesiacus TaxID=285564 RepID=UPI003F4A5520
MSHETPQSLENDGYWTQLARYADGRVLLRSRKGTDMTPAFPEIRDAALAQLPDDTVFLDGGTDLAPWPYSRRRAALEELFAENGLTMPLTLCPSTPNTARQWLTWTSAGLEGLFAARVCR